MLNELFYRLVQLVPVVVCFENKLVDACALLASSTS